MLIFSFYLSQNCFDYNKLYIGQLALSITQQFIRDVLSKYTQVRDVRIIKGDARGTFDRFCYAFAMVRGTEEICNQVIKKVNQHYPEWKLNVKVDNDRFKYMQPQSTQPRQNQPPTSYYPQHQQSPTQNRMGYDAVKEPQSNYYERPNYQQQHHQPHHYQGGQNYPGQQGYGYNNNNVIAQQFSSSHSLTSNVNEPQKIIGQKQNKILVRQIWLGGIPQMCDKFYMQQLMSQFGMVQNLQIFPKFAFIKFRMVDQATLAYQRAQRIFIMFGSPPGFKISFSEPSKRANVVSNHYEYDRQSPFLPVLFLGFPPVTSANIDLEYMKSIVQKYGTIVNSYMRKNSNNQLRSYFLFTYDNIKSALRAKAQLNKRRDLLGDKRVQVTLLIDDQVILRGRDLSHTDRMFRGDPNLHSDKKKPSMERQFQKTYEKPYEKPQYPVGNQQFGNYPPKDLPMSNIPNMPNVNVPNSPYGYHGGMQYGGYVMPPNIPPQNYPSDMYYMQPNYYDPKYPKQSTSTSDVHDLIQSVLQKPTLSSSLDRKDQGLQKKPIKTNTNNQQSVSDIVSKMLGSTQKDEYHYNQKDKQRQPTWSGFLTWKGVKRIGVDGHTQFKQPEDYAINIMNLIQYKDIIMKQKATMILEPSSSIYESQFKQFIRALRSKVGVSFTSNFLMYVMSKSKESDQIKQIKDNQLLVIMEKTSLGSLIRDKLQKCQELK